MSKSQRSEKENSWKEVKVVSETTRVNQKSVGIEVEFLLLNSKGEAIVPPAYWDRDGFPLLGEIRGDPGDTAADVIANFTRRKMKILKKVKQGNKIVFENIHQVRLKTYKEAMKQVTEAKGEQIGKTKNIYGISVEDYSDQVIKKGKIQGVNASCGLHIHFSCNQESELKVDEPVYEEVRIPVEMVPMAKLLKSDIEIKGATEIVKSIMRPEFTLYRREGWSEKKILRASASQLNRPTIEWIVKEMDEKLFKQFAPAEKYRTKYRQAGFYEIKPHGFEYRSLPANDQTLAALPEIVDFAFELLNNLENYI